MTIFFLLLSLALFQVKHYFADYHWQTTWMIQNKARYGHPGGLVHAFVHAVLSVPALMVAAGGWAGLIGLLLVAEFAIHYHVDWFKMQLGARGAADAGDQAFWRLVGLDQMAHQFTYLGMVLTVFWAS